MKRLHVLVEGQTEEAFVRDVLGPHLQRFGKAATPVLLKTKRVKSGGAFRGGVTSKDQVLGDIRRLLGDTGVAAVTTLLDYYGLPADFPGMATRPAAGAAVRVAHVEAELDRAVGAPRFVPHLVLHEYEAWIFSGPAQCAWVFDDPGVATQLAAIATTAGGPERVNDGPTTAPSKRIQAIFPPYRKTYHGPLAVDAIGLGVVRGACPHADAWLTRLELL